MITSASFKSHLSSAVCLCLAVYFTSPTVSRAFTAQETLVSTAGVPMPDIEFDRTNFQVAWEDQQDRLWVAPVSPVDGTFDLAHELQLDAHLAPLAGFQTHTGTANGPEWDFTTGTSQILYTKNIDNLQGDLEVWRSVELNGQWTSGAFLDANSLSFGPKGFVPVGNTRLDDPAPAFVFYTDDPVTAYPRLAWRRLLDSTAYIIDSVPDGVARVAMSDSGQVVYPKRAPDGSKQIFLFNASNQRVTQLTTSSTIKTDAWLFDAPELGGEQVLAVMESVKNQNTNICIYRLKGKVWTLYNTLHPPSQYPELDSPEPFIFNGQSYMFCVARQSKNKTLPSEVWIMSVRRDIPFYRQVSVSSISMARQDPEFLLTQTALYIYFTEVKAGAIYQCLTGLGPTASNVINGTSGDDVLKGTSANDYLIGGGGADTLTGGEGVDQFVYEHLDDAGDTIKDFTEGSDLINMVFLMASLGYTGSNPLADGYIQFQASGKDTKVLIDPDGTAGPKKAAFFILVKNIKPNDLNDLKNFVF